MRDATQKWPLFQSDLEIHAAALVMLTHDVMTLASSHCISGQYTYRELSAIHTD